MTITASEFGYIRDLVRDRAAIVLEDGKEYLVSARLAPVARQEGVTSIGELVGRLRTKPHGPLHSAVIEAMTTNETSFFRDPAVFEGLRATIIPELIKARGTARRLDIWSAAASTGQESYSIAMMLREHFPELRAWTTHILGTDINEQVLNKARQARYTQFEVNRGLPAPMLARWFARQGAEWQLDKQVSSDVDFRPLNLIAPGMFPVSDLIMLRNVLIYFNDDTKRQILAKARAALRPGGFLVLGSSESPLLLQEGFQRVEIGRASCYRPT
jgi:chemotaxis protein methyltransferase CheR